MKPMFLYSKLAEANESFRGRAAQSEPAAPSQAKAARPSCCMWFVPETEEGLGKENAHAMDGPAFRGREAQQPLLFRQGKEITTRGVQT